MHFNAFATILLLASTAVWATPVAERQELDHGPDKWHIAEQDELGSSLSSILLAGAGTLWLDRRFLNMCQGQGAARMGRLAEIFASLLSSRKEKQYTAEDLKDAYIRCCVEMHLVEIRKWNGPDFKDKTVIERLTNKCKGDMLVWYNQHGFKLAKDSRPSSANDKASTTTRTDLFSGLQGDAGSSLGVGAAVGAASSSAIPATLTAGDFRQSLKSAAGWVLRQLGQSTAGVGGGSLY